MTIQRKFITIVIDHDTEKHDHPRDWDWPTLLDLPAEQVLRVEVFSVGSQIEQREVNNTNGNGNQTEEARRLNDAETHSAEQTASEPKPEDPGTGEAGSPAS